MAWPLSNCVTSDLTSSSLSFPRYQVQTILHASHTKPLQDLRPGGPKAPTEMRHTQALLSANASLSPWMSYHKGWIGCISEGSLQAYRSQSLWRLLLPMLGWAYLASVLRFLGFKGERLHSSAWPYPHWQKVLLNHP